MIEGGPDSFISSKPEAMTLIRELGLESEVIGSNDRQRITYILRNGRLVPLPEGLIMIVPSRIMPLLKSPLLGWGTKIRMAREFFRRPTSLKRSAPDRSVAEFVIDHFGRETLDYLAEPLLSGVYGGDPAELSASSVLPRFVQMERQYGSLGRAVLHTRGQASPNASLFRTLRSGLGTLVEALAAGLTVRHQAAEALEKNQTGGFRVRAGGDWLEAKQVILACPAWAASDLISGLNPEIARQLAGIPYSSSVTLSLIYSASEFDGMRAGFGFLIPRRERQRLVAATFVGTKFPYRAPEDRVLLRCFFGGTRDEAVLRESDESLVAMARQELNRILDLTASPLFHTVSRWPRSMAQYTVGHSARVLEIRNRMASIRGLYLAGNAYEGIGIPDCVRTGRTAAREILSSPNLSRLKRAPQQ